MATEELTPSPAPDAPPIATTPADTPLLGGGGDPSPADLPADDAPAEPDWRDRIAELAGFKDDPREMAWLKRFASEANYHKAIPKLRRDFSAGKAQPALAEGATPEEIAAYRKAAGVPEAPDGYGFALPKELQPTERDTAAVGEFAKFLHDRHISANDPGAKAAFDFYAKSMAENRAAMAEVMHEARRETEAELRSEWKGRDYQRNITITQGYLASEFEGREATLDFIMNAEGTLPDGRKVKVGDYADTIRAFNQIALRNAPDGALIAGDVAASGGKTLEDRIADLDAKMRAPGIANAEYNRLHAEQRSLFEQQVKMQERNGRGKRAA